MKKYIIFDMDWTLINSIWSCWDIIVDTCKNINPKLKKSEIINTLIKYDWCWPKDYLKYIFTNLSEKELNQIENKIYQEIIKNDWWKNFFPWVIDTIKKLSKNYKFFLCTWNSTQFAIKKLKEWWVYELFEIVHWSEQISKSVAHINYFKEYCLDAEFEKNTIYFWDWNNDRFICEQTWIDFVKIWDEWKDKYTISSIWNWSEVENIIEKIKSE